MVVYIIFIILLISVLFVGLQLMKYRSEVIQLRHNRDRYKTIGQIVKSINAGMSSERIIQIALEELAKRYPLYRVSYSTVSEQGILKIWRCSTPKHMPNIEGLESDLNIAPDYLKELNQFKLLAVSDVLTDHRFLPLQEPMTKGNTRAVLDVPVSHNKGVVGLFCLDSSEKHEWTVEEIKMVSEIAEFMEIAIKQADYLKHKEDMAIQLEDYNKRLEIEVREQTKELQYAKQTAEQLAMTDELTQLPNRRAFFSAGEQLYLQAKRHASSFCVVTFDIDKFKDINDNYGHEIGDIALKEMGEVLTSISRSSDIIGRIGGEEFAMILADTEIAGAIQFAERLRVLTQQNTMNTSKGEIQFTISTGVAQFSEQDDSLKSVIARADTALFVAKERGRNLVISELQVKR